jgi:hypothetical protein
MHQNLIVQTLVQLSPISDAGINILSLNTKMILYLTLSDFIHYVPTPKNCERKAASKRKITTLT